MSRPETGSSCVPKPSSPSSPVTGSETSFFWCAMIVASSPRSSEACTIRRPVCHIGAAATEAVALLCLLFAEVEVQGVLAAIDHKIDLHPIGPCHSQPQLLG